MNIMRNEALERLFEKVEAQARKLARHLYPGTRWQTVATTLNDKDLTGNKGHFVVTIVSPSKDQRWGLVYVVEYYEDTLHVVRYPKEFALDHLAGELLAGMIGATPQAAVEGAAICWLAQTGRPTDWPFTVAVDTQQDWATIIFHETDTHTALVARMAVGPLTEEQVLYVCGEPKMDKEIGIYHVDEYDGCLKTRARMIRAMSQDPYYCDYYGSLPTPLKYEHLDWDKIGGIYVLQPEELRHIADLQELVQAAVMSGRRILVRVQKHQKSRTITFGLEHYPGQVPDELHPHNMFATGWNELGEFRVHGNVRVFWQIAELLETKAEDTIIWVYSYQRTAHIAIPHEIFSFVLSNHHRMLVSGLDDHDNPLREIAIPVWLWDSVLFRTAPENLHILVAGELLRLKDARVAFVVGATVDATALQQLRTRYDIVVVPNNAVACTSPYLRSYACDPGDARALDCLFLGSAAMLTNRDLVPYQPDILVTRAAAYYLTRAVPDDEGLHRGTLPYEAYRFHGKRGEEPTTIRDYIAIYQAERAAATLVFEAEALDGELTPILKFAA